MEFEDRLKKLRKSIGYNQRAFGDLLGLSYQAVSDLERGTNKPSNVLLAYLKFRFGKIFGDSVKTPDFEKTVTDFLPTEKTVTDIVNSETQTSEFAIRLKLLRKSLGHNQSTFAKLLGLTGPHLSQLENEKRLPGKTLIVHLRFRYPTIFGDGVEYPDFEQFKAQETVSVLKNEEPYKTKPTDIGARLKQVRDEWGLTENEMASRLNLGPSSYRCYELGEQDIPASVLVALVEAGVDVAWLLKGVVPEDPKKVVGFDTIVAEHFDIVLAFKNKELAKAINDKLVQLESADPEILEEIDEYIDLKLRRIFKSEKQEGVMGGRAKTGNG